jgi:ABC-2 type transport system permease protein
MSEPTLSSAAAVRLITAREITMMLRSTAVRVVTALILLAIIAAVVIVTILTGTAGSRTTVGITRSDTSFAAPLRATATALGREVTIRTVPSQTAGVAQVANGTLDALLAENNGRLRVIVKHGLDPGLRQTLSSLARRLTLDQQIRALGGNPATVNQKVTMAADVAVEVLSPPTHYDVAAIVLGSAAGVLIYISLMLQGQRVAQGVVEEKSSRVVELLLSTVRPWQLMAGKVAGIGLVGLAQMLVFGTVGVALAVGLGVLHISISVAVGTVAWLVVWYLLGFVLYAFALAAAGALVSRQEDASTVVMPVLIPVIAGYILGISLLPGHPDSRLCEILSIIPVFSPTLMPMRLAMGSVPAWETVASILLAAGSIPLLAGIAGRIYSNAVLRTGARVAFIQALRTS